MTRPSEKNWVEMRELLQSDDTLFLTKKLYGGFLSEAIDAILSFLRPILDPIRDVVMTIVKLAELFVTIAEIIVHVFEMIPLIFDPAALIDDIMYGVTFGINEVVASMTASINPQSPENDEDTEKGPFGISNTSSANRVCLKPSVSILSKSIFLILLSIR